MMLPARCMVQEASGREKKARPSTSGRAGSGVGTMGHSSCAFLYFAAFLAALFYSKNLDGEARAPPLSVSGAELAPQGTNNKTSPSSHVWQDWAPHQ